MSIVVLTIPEDGRLEFAGKLNEVTGGKVALVIMQRRKKKTQPLSEQIKNFYRIGGIKNILVELWCAVILRLSKRKRVALSYFRVRDTLGNYGDKFPVKILEVESHNDEETLRVLRKVSPKLLVIWSNTIVKPEIIATAKEAINLHMGLCPYYRGFVANQYALLLEPKRLGATVHHVEARVDTGDIIGTITMDLAKPPRESFRDLNRRAEELYLEVAKKLYFGEKLPRQPQDKTVGRNFKLRDWTPRFRVRVAKLLIDWEEKGVLTK